MPIPMNRPVYWAVPINSPVWRKEAERVGNHEDTEKGGEKIGMFFRDEQMEFFTAKRLDSKAQGRGLPRTLGTRSPKMPSLR